MNALLWRYASLRLPLAILELPLYVLLPKLYSELLPIGIVGLMLLAARALDALADPWLGRRWDVQSVLSAQALSKRAWYSLSMASTVFVLGFLCLLWWPMFAKAWALEGLWSGLVLGIASILTYLAYSQCSIVYQSWGSALAKSDQERSRFALSREAAGLLGVMLVSVFVQAQSAGEKNCNERLACGVYLACLVAFSRFELSVSLCCTKPSSPDFQSSLALALCAHATAFYLFHVERHCGCDPCNACVIFC